MQVELNNAQLIGVSLAVIGLVTNNVLIIWFYIRIIRVLKKNGIKPNGFPLLAFYFQFRLLVKTAFNKRQQADYQKALTFMGWSMVITICMMILGCLIVIM